MTIIYNAKVSSTNKQIDGLPMELPVGLIVTCSIKSVDKLKYNATEEEKLWYKEQIVPNVVEEQQ